MSTADRRGARRVVRGETAADEAGGGAPAALGALVELLARRFALGAFWHLRGGPTSFRVLRTRLNAPEAGLSQRLRELREAGLVEVDEVGEYRLTAHGRRLQGVVEPLASWAGEWVELSPRQRAPRGAASRGDGEP